MIARQPHFPHHGFATGGVREAYKQKGEDYELFWPVKPEFVRVAARFNATIVPLAAVGADDGVEMLLDSNDILNLPVLGVPHAFAIIQNMWTTGQSEGGMPREGPVWKADCVVLQKALCVYVCVCRWWCHTWVGELLTVAAWMQVALLSGYTLRAVLRATHSAVVRGLSTGPQDCNQTVKFVYHMGPLLPFPRRCAIVRCLQWLKKNAIWRGTEYSSWSLPLHLRPGNTWGAWCSDYTALVEHSHCLHHSGPSAQPLCVCDPTVTLGSNKICAPSKE